MSSRKLIDKIFEIGILAKAIFGFFEIAGGVLVAFSGHRIIDNLILFFAESEIAESKSDVIAEYLGRLAVNFTMDKQVFAVAYLFFHGAVNIFLAIALAKGRTSLYSAIILLFMAFIIYQLYKYFFTLSPALLFLTFFDIFFVWIIWMEYKGHKNKQRA